MRRWLLPLLLILITVALWPDASAALTQPGRSFHQTTTIVPPDLRAGIHFGQAVALDGDTLAVGAPFAALGEQFILPLRGAVYIFTRSGGQWTFRQKLSASPSGSLDEFGAALALDGDRLLVGAPAADPAEEEDAGAAYLFERVDGVWSQQAVLSASYPQANAQLGTAVALQGALALAGAPVTKVGDKEGQGAVMVFSEASNWKQHTLLLDPNGEEFDGFGTAVAIDGTLTAFGAPYAGDGDHPGGTTVVFRRTLSGWQPGPTLGNDSIYDYDARLGRAVAVDGVTVLAGAPYAPTGGLAQGFTSVFIVGSQVWYEQAQIIAEDGGNSDSLGYAVALEGDTALLGAPKAPVDAEPEPLTFRGAVYHYRRLDGNWSLVDRLIAAPIGAQGDDFGEALALDGGTAAIGAPEVAVSGFDSAGKVYIFEQVPLIFLPFVKG